MLYLVTYLLQSYSVGHYEPSWAGFNYGAWYLPAKTWKKRGLDEPLVDPKQIKVGFFSLQLILNS